MSTPDPRARELKTAKILSYLFLPPVLNLLSFSFVIFGFEREPGSARLIFFYTSFFTVLLPVLIFILFLRKGKIADPDARVRSERHVPYIVFTIVISAGLLLIPWGNFSSEVHSLYIIYLFNLIFLFLVNLFWKISAHTMGAGGFTGTLLFATGIYGLAGIPVILLLAWARMKLDCHTPAQLVAGAVAGLINTLLLFYFL